MTETGATKPTRRRVKTEQTVELPVAAPTAKARSKKTPAPVAEPTAPRRGQGRPRKTPAMAVADPDTIMVIGSEGDLAEVQLKDLQVRRPSTATRLTQRIKVRPDLIRDVQGEVIWPELGPETKPLWPYQAQVVANTLKAFAAKHRAVIMHTPTGGGKTVMASNILRRMYKVRKPVLVVAHTHELVEQAVNTVVAAGVPQVAIGIIDPEHLMDPGQERLVYVASLLSLKSWLVGNSPERQVDMGWFDLILIDEAHRATAASYDVLFEQRAPVLGLTGTPKRHSAGNLARRFDGFVRGPSTAQLIRQGTIVPTKYIVPEQLLSDEDLRASLKRGGTEYDDAKVSALMEAKADKVFGSVVRTYLQMGEDRQTLVFAPSVIISRGLVARFNASGVLAGHIDSSTPKPERVRLMAEFLSGRIRILSSVGVFVEGVDAPECSCIIGMRPSLSLIFHLQQGGRGVRASKGKADCLFFDFVGNVLNEDLGVIDRPQVWDDPAWTLEDGNESSAVKQKAKVTAVTCSCEQCQEQVLVPLKRTVYLENGRTAQVRPGQQTYLTPFQVRAGYRHHGVRPFYCPNGHEMWGQALPFTCAVCNHHDGESDGTGLCPKCGSYDPSGHQSAWATDLSAEVSRVFLEELGMQFGGQVVDWSNLEYRGKVQRAAAKNATLARRTEQEEKRKAEQDRLNLAAHERAETNKLAARLAALGWTVTQPGQSAQEPTTAPQQRPAPTTPVYTGDKAVWATWWAGLQYISQMKGHTGHSAKVPFIRFQTRFGLTVYQAGVQNVPAAPPTQEVADWVAQSVRTWLAQKK